VLSGTVEKWETLKQVESLEELSIDRQEDVINVLKRKMY
jgi:hypothetical protein